jgi:hypothetical protein
MIRTLNYFIQDRMPNSRPPPHPCVYPDLGGVGRLRKCKSSILSGLPQAKCTLRKTFVAMNCMDWEIGGEGSSLLEAWDFSDYSRE